MAARFARKRFTKQSRRWDFFKISRPEGKGPIIGIGGCVGQLDKGNLFKRAPYLDFVFGTDTIDNLPEIVHRVRNGERHVVYADFDKSMDYSTETKVHIGQSASLRQHHEGLR